MKLYKVIYATSHGPREFEVEAKNPTDAMLSYLERLDDKFLVAMLGVTVYEMVEKARFIDAEWSEAAEAIIVFRERAVVLKRLREYQAEAEERAAVEQRAAELDIEIAAKREP